MSQQREESQRYVVMETSAVIRRELTADEKQELLDDYLVSDHEIHLFQTEFSLNNIRTTTSALSNGTKVTYLQYSPATSKSKMVSVGYEIIESRHHSTVKTADMDEIERAESLPTSAEPTDYDRDLTTVSRKQFLGLNKERNQYYRALDQIAELATSASESEEPNFRGYFQIVSVLANAGIIKEERV